MAKGTSNTMKIAYLLATGFAIWYLLNKTALGAEFAGEMLSFTEGVVAGAGEGIRPSGTVM